MVKKILKVGEELAIVLDKKVIKKLHITEDSEFRITTEGQRIIIEKIHEITKVSDDPKMQEAYERFIKKYAPALKKLAEY